MDELTEMVIPSEGELDCIEVSEDLRFVAVKTVFSSDKKEDLGSQSNSVFLFSLATKRLLSSFSSIPHHFMQMMFLPGADKLVLSSFQRLMILKISEDGKLTSHSQTNLPRFVVNRIACVGSFLVRFASSQIIVWDIHPFKQIFSESGINALSLHFNRFENKIFFKTFDEGKYHLKFLDLSKTSGFGRSTRLEELCEIPCSFQSASLAFARKCSLLAIIDNSNFQLIDTVTCNRLRQISLKPEKALYQNPLLSFPKQEVSSLCEWIYFAFFGRHKPLEFSDDDLNESETLKRHHSSGTSIHINKTSIKTSNISSICEVERFSPFLWQKYPLVKFCHRKPLKNTSRSTCKVFGNNNTLLSLNFK